MGDRMFFEEGHIFLLKGFCAVMLGLVFYVFPDCLDIGNAHGERTVPCCQAKFLTSIVS